MGILKAKTADFSGFQLVMTDASGATVTFGAAGLQGLALDKDMRLSPQGICDAATVLGKVRLEAKVSAKAIPLGGDKAVTAGSGRGIKVEAADAAAAYGADFGIRPSATAIFILQEQEKKAQAALEQKRREEEEEQARRLAQLRAQAGADETEGTTEETPQSEAPAPQGAVAGSNGRGRRR